MAGLTREAREALAETLFAVRANLVAGDPVVPEAVVDPTDTPPAEKRAAHG